MAATTQHHMASFSRHARFIGRVGALAVTLGIGTAIANSPGIAAADDGTSGAVSSDAVSSNAVSTNAASSNAVSSNAGAGSAAGPSESDPGSETKDTDPEVAEDPEVAKEPDDELDSDSDSDSASPTAEVTSSNREATRNSVEVVAPAIEAESDKSADDEPESPATAAMVTLAGSARREIAPDTTSPHASPVARVSQSVAATAGPLLGTRQQLEAERLAAQTVRTWPVRLMKFVLGAGWLMTANREYQQTGGADHENLRQLGRAVDEYALGAAFQQQLLNPMNPTVVTQVAPPHTWYGRQVDGSRILYDNPDTVYRFMGVNQTSTYVIRGRFTGAMPADTNFSVLTGLSGVTADNLSGRQIDIGPDGSFTITVSGHPAASGQRNHLQMTADTTLIAVRNTLSDWNTQLPMTLSIERLSGPRNSLFSQLGGFAIPGLGPAVTRSPLLTALVSLIPPMREPPPILRGVFTAVIMALGRGRSRSTSRSQPPTPRRASASHRMCSRIRSATPSSWRPSCRARDTSSWPTARHSWSPSARGTPAISRFRSPTSGRSPTTTGTIRPASTMRRPSRMRTARTHSSSPRPIPAFTTGCRQAD